MAAEGQVTHLMGLADRPQCGLVIGGAGNVRAQ